MTSWGTCFPAKILFEGKTFNSAEALVQWGKFPHLPVIQNEIRYAKTPFWSWKGGNDRRKATRKDWEDVRDSVMKETLYLKFSQHTGLAESLLATGDHELVSEEPDRYWGAGVDGAGENRLGRVLMELRDYLKRKLSDVSPQLKGLKNRIRT